MQSDQAQPTLLTEIVVVEDEYEDRRTIVDALNPFVGSGHIQEFGRHEDALRFITNLNSKSHTQIQSALRLFLLDYNLDGDTVLPLLALLRKGAATRFIPAVVFSDSGNPGNIRRCYDAGANAFVVKPVDFESFGGAVQHIADFWLETNRV